jgi:hypothetical protein
MRDFITTRLGRASLIVFGFIIAAPVRAQATNDSLQSPPLSTNYWGKFGLGVSMSLLLHEAAHVATAKAVGGHPSFGFDTFRPTIYSGIKSTIEPHKQYLFSVAGLAVQNALDEAILDIPHARGSAFERGILGGGLGTTIFYLTIGRRGSVSDIDFIARMHGMTKAQATLLFGGISAVHIIRISRDPHYANFFARPSADGRIDFGIEWGRRTTGDRRR